MRACEILPRILIDNLHCFKHTWNSNVDAYHGKWAFMPSSVLELLPNFKSTYFASMNPPIIAICIEKETFYGVSKARPRFSLRLKEGGLTPHVSPLGPRTP